VVAAAAARYAAATASLRHFRLERLQLLPNNSKVGREGVRLQTDAMHASCQSGGGAALSLRGIRRPSAAQLNEESSSYIVLWMKAATGKKGKA